MQKFQHKFNTRYNFVRQVPSIMDPHDNVDRLSYVDSTRMVQRMILEGQNLNAYRAAAQRAGMYKVDDAFNDETVPPVPVFETDPVILSGIKEQYEGALNDSLAKKSSSDLKDTDSGNAAEKVDSTPDGE